MVENSVIVFLDLPSSGKSRIFDREVCANCQESYHFRLKPPQISGRCDKEGAILVRRQNDDPVIVERRLEKFHQEKEAILSVFRGAKSFIAQIDGTGTVKETYQKALQELKIPLLSHSL